MQSPSAASIAKCGILNRSGTWIQLESWKVNACHGMYVCCHVRPVREHPTDAQLCSSHRPREDGKLRPNDPLASPAVHWDYHNRPRWDGSCHDHKFTTQLQRQSALKSCFHELSARMHTVHTYNIAYCNFVSFTYIRTYCQCGFLLQMRLPTTVRTSGILPRQQ